MFASSSDGLFSNDRYDRLIRSASERYFGMESDWRWHKARIYVESRFNVKAVSPVGAAGIAQFMSETAMDYGARSPADRFDPEWSINAMVHYIKDIWTLLESARPDGTNVAAIDRERLADASYNAGQGRILKALKKYGYSWKTIKPHIPSETQSYSERIQSQKQIYMGIKNE